MSVSSPLSALPLESLTLCRWEKLISSQGCHHTPPQLAHRFFLSALASSSVASPLASPDGQCFPHVPVLGAGCSGVIVLPAGRPAAHAHGPGSALPHPEQRESQQSLCWPNSSRSDRGRVSGSVADVLAALRTSCWDWTASDGEDSDSLMNPSSDWPWEALQLTWKAADFMISPSALTEPRSLTARGTVQGGCSTAAVSTRPRSQRARCPEELGLQGAQPAERGLWPPASLDPGQSSGAPELPLRTLLTVRWEVQRMWLLS